MTLRITRDDGVPEGLLEGFPYREIREEEERRSASSRWPLLAAVDRQVREAEQRSFLRNRGPEESADDTVGDEAFAACVVRRAGKWRFASVEGAPADQVLAWSQRYTLSREEAP